MERFPQIEIQLCESIDRAPTGMQSPATYHVEIRIVPFKGASCVRFQGAKYLNRIVAEDEKKAAIRMWAVEVPDRHTVRIIE